VGRQLAVLAAIAAMCAALVAGLAALPHRTGPTDTWSQVPRGATLVASVEVPALLDSPLWRGLVGDDAQGLARLRTACGFDLLERVRTVAIVALGSEEQPFEHLGFLARGELPRRELIECIERAFEADGVSTRRMSIDGLPAIASAQGTSRVVFLRGDTVIGGDETLVREMIRVERGETPSANADEWLARMWQRIHDRGEIAIAARLPPRWRQWLVRLSGRELQGIEELRAIGLGATIHRRLGLTLVADATDEAHARTVAEAVRARIAEALEHPLFRSSPVGTALERLDLDVEGARVLATVDLDAEHLAALIAFGREALRGRPVGSRAPRAEDGSPVGPDETLRPRATFPTESASPTAEPSP
jgi:hypothetical protein